VGTILRIQVAVFLAMFFIFSELAFTASLEKITKNELTEFMQDFGKWIEKKDAKCFNSKLHTQIYGVMLKDFGCSSKNENKSTPEEFVACAFTGKMFDVLSNCFVTKTGRISKSGYSIILPDAYICFVEKEGGKIKLSNIVLTD
jgi:predicted small secreted protein